MCCRGPLILSLTADEVLMFERYAASLGVSPIITPSQGGGGWLKFSDHPGERCPMLDGATSACKIYNDRPHRCREFPEKPTPGCAISGG
jgi:Fe-S-cluster containining protein